MPYFYVEHLRRARGLTQLAVARRTELPQSKVSLVEAGERVSDNVLRILARFYGCQPDQLQRPMPATLDQVAVGERVEREFEAKEREARRRDAAEVPPAPSLRDAIKRSRS